MQAVQEATSVVAKAARQLEPIAQTAAHSGVDMMAVLLSRLSEPLSTDSLSLDA